MSKLFGLAAAALAFGALSVAPASAHGRHHHHGHHHGHHAHAHWHGGWHHPHRHAGWGGWHRGGPRPVLVAGGYPVYAQSYRVHAPHPGCSTRQRIGLTHWGMRKVVTTRTCIVP